MARDKKGAVEQNATLLFVDEASLCLTPTVRRTWAPRGKTPILKHTASKKRLHLIGAIGCTPTGEECRLLIQAQEVPVETVSFLHFLGEVTAHFSGKVIVVMDNLSAHHSGLVVDFLEEHSDRLSAEYFPSYSPELNPVEYLWSAIKGKDVANLPARDLADLECAAEQASVRIESDQEIMKGFLRGSGLFMPLADVPE